MLESSHMQASQEQLARAGISQPDNATAQPDKKPIPWAKPQLGENLHPGDRTTQQPPRAPQRERHLVGPSGSGIKTQVIQEVPASDLSRIMTFTPDVPREEAVETERVVDQALRQQDKVQDGPGDQAPTPPSSPKNPIAIIQIGKKASSSDVNEVMRFIPTVATDRDDKDPQTISDASMPSGNDPDPEHRPPPAAGGMGGGVDSPGGYSSEAGGEGFRERFTRAGAAMRERQAASSENHFQLEPINLDGQDTPIGTRAARASVINRDGVDTLRYDEFTNYNDRLSFDTVFITTKGGELRASRVRVVHPLPDGEPTGEEEDILIRDSTDPAHIAQAVRVMEHITGIREIPQSSVVTIGLNDPLEEIVPIPETGSQESLRVAAKKSLLGFMSEDRPGFQTPQDIMIFARNMEIATILYMHEQLLASAAAQSEQEPELRQALAEQEVVHALGRRLAESMGPEARSQLAPAAHAFNEIVVPRYREASVNEAARSGNMQLDTVNETILTAQALQRDLITMGADDPHPAVSETEATRAAQRAEQTTPRHTLPVLTEEMARELYIPGAWDEVKQNYAERLQREPDFVHYLLEAFRRGQALNQTYFFRHPVELEILANDIIPSFPPDRRIRIASVGTSTGMDVLSVLMKLWDSKDRVAITGLDVDPLILDIARIGKYPNKGFKRPHIPQILEQTPLKTIQRNVPKRVQKEVLHVENTPAGKMIVIHDQARDHIQYAEWDILLQGPLPEQQEVIFWDNVGMYFSPAGRALALRNIRQSLTPDGWLICEPTIPTTNWPEHNEWMKDLSAYGFERIETHDKALIKRKIYRVIPDFETPRSENE